MSFDKEVIMEEVLKRIILENQERIEHKKLIPRYLVLPEIEQISIITGLRRSGKTSLLFIETDKYPKEDVLFLDFEDERLVMLNSLSSYDCIIDSYKRLFEERKPVLFFDEIQGLKNWYLYVKRLYSQGFKIYITGSNSDLITRDISTYISGRGVEFEILPFSFFEFLQLKGRSFQDSDLFTKVPKILNLFDDYLLYGGLPEVIRSDDKMLSIRSIFDLLFYKDLIARFKCSEYGVKLVISKLVENVGKYFSLNKLHNKLKPLYNISKPTTIQYVNILEKPYLVQAVFQYRKSFVQRERERKVYFMDNSFITLNSVEPDLGKLLENLVFIELRREHKELYYHKTTKGFETDFVVPKEKKAFQVSYSLKDVETREREVRALISTMKELDLMHGTILTYNEEEMLIESGFDIEVIPVWKWLLKKTVA